MEWVSESKIGTCSDRLRNELPIQFPEKRCLPHSSDQFQHLLGYNCSAHIVPN